MTDAAQVELLGLREQVRSLKKSVMQLKNKLGRSRREHEAWVVRILFSGDEATQAKAMALLRETRHRMEKPR